MLIKKRQSGLPLRLIDSKTRSEYRRHKTATILTGYDCPVPTSCTTTVHILTSLVHLFSDMIVYKEYFNRFGIYFEHTRTTRPLFPSGYVMYDNKSNEFLSLQDASEKRLLNLDAYCIDTYFTDIEFSIVGAVGWPAGILDIVSVTYLQMDLAKETSEYDVRTVDFNNDGKYNIKDATDIQKYLVGAEI